MTSSVPGAQPEQVRIDPDQLVYMRGIVKTYNEGKDTELTVLHGIDFDTKHGEFVPSLVHPAAVSRR